MWTHFGKLVVAASVFACLAGVLFATVGPNLANHIKFNLPGMTRGIIGQEMAVDKSEAANSNAEAEDSSTPSPTPFSDPKYYPADQISARNSGYRNNDVSSSVDSTKQLIVSANPVRMGITGHSEILTAQSPDGYELCSIASDYTQTAPAAVRPNGAGCSIKLQFMFAAPTQPGTYTVHVFAETTSKVRDGKYVVYHAQVTVIAASAYANPKFSIGTVNSNIPRNSEGKVDSFPVYLELWFEAGHPGEPQMKYTFSRPGVCTNIQAGYINTNKYSLRCFPLNQDHDSFTITFRANDGKTLEQVIVVNIQY